MSDQWYYRIKGKEFGPVALDLVRSLIATGTIAPDDEVRAANQSNWHLACAATEIRDARRSPSAMPAIERRMARDEWYYRGATGDIGPLKLIDLIQMSAQGKLTPEEEIKATATDYWKQVRSYGRLNQLLPLMEDSSLARIRNRNPTDMESLVKTTHALTQDLRAFIMGGATITTGLRQPDEFLSVEDAEPGAIPTSDFADVLQFPSLQTQSADCTVNDTPTSQAFDDDSDVDNAKADSNPLAHDDKEELEDETQSITIAIPSRQQLVDCDILASRLVEKSKNTSSDQHLWTGWIAGQEFGPVDYSQLLTWAVTGQLAPTDFVRCGQEGRFVPAVNIPCLFTVKPATSLLSGLRQRSEPSDSTDSPLNAQLPGPVTRAEREPSEGKDDVPTQYNTPGDQDDFAPTIIRLPVFHSNIDPAHSPPPAASKLTTLATDPTSVGVSAMLTIGLVVLGWIASL